MNVGALIKIITLGILSLFLLVLLLYHVVFHDNGKYYYRDQYEDLLRWSRPFEECIVETYEGNKPYVTPILGTDADGKDLAYRVSKALFTNLWLSILGAGIVFLCLGTVFGVLIGYDRPREESLAWSWERFMRFNFLRDMGAYRAIQGIVTLLVQAFHAIPLLLLVLIAVVVVEKFLSSDLLRMLIIMGAVGVFSTPKLALLIKDRIELLEKEEFISATKASGLSDLQIVGTHIIRYECSSIIIGQAVYVLVQAIMLEAVVSFLGYGIRGYRYESIGKLIAQFQNQFPGAIGGEPMALVPIFVLLALAVVGNGWGRVLLSYRYE